jgi:hypothetical protein
VYTKIIRTWQKEKPAGESNLRLTFLSRFYYFIKISTHHLTWLTISEKISYERDERPFGAIPIDGKLIAVVFRLIA